MFALLGAHGLNPPHGHALAALAAGPIRMRELADHMLCDASYITSIVDRLEETGLAVRRADPTDRRVKTIALTEKGERAAADIRLTMSAPPAEFKRLTKAELAVFASAMERLVPETTAADPFRVLPKPAQHH